MSEITVTAAIKGGVVPYLMVDGAIKASEFYVKAFGAEVAQVVPPDDQGRSMHVHVHINGQSLMLSDFYPEHGVPKVAPQAFNLMIRSADIQADWDRAVAAGGQVVMPLADMFWGERYGQLKDPFGVTWAIAQPLK